MILDFTTACNCNCALRFSNSPFAYNGAPAFPTTSNFSFLVGEGTWLMHNIDKGDYSIDLYFNPDPLLSYQKSSLYHHVDISGPGTEIEISILKGFFGNPPFDDTRYLIEYFLSPTIVLRYDVTNYFKNGELNQLSIVKSGVTLNSVKLYFNKYPITPESSISSPLNTTINQLIYPTYGTSPLHIGAKVVSGTPDFLYSGSIAQYRVYNRKLTKEEIQATSYFFKPLNAKGLVFWAPFNSFEPFRMGVPIYGGNAPGMFFNSNPSRTLPNLIECEDPCEPSCLDFNEPIDILPAQKNDTFILDWDFPEYIDTCGVIHGPLQIAPQLCTSCSEDKNPPSITADPPYSLFFIHTLFKLSLQKNQTSGSLHIQRWKGDVPTIDPPIVVNFTSISQFITDLTAIPYFYYDAENDIFEFRYSNCEIITTDPPPCGCGSQELIPVFINTEDPTIALQGASYYISKRKIDPIQACKECEEDPIKTYYVITLYNICYENVSPLTCVKDSVLKFTFSESIPAFYRCPLTLCFAGLDAKLVCSNYFDVRENHCDTVLLRWRNYNQTFRQLRIRAHFNRKQYNKDQKISSAKRNKTEKLNSMVDSIYMLETDFYTEKIHNELIRAFESDILEIFYKNKWVSFFSEKEYELEWEDAPKPRVAKGSVELTVANYLRLNNIE